jgi:adenylate cyclase
MTRKSETLAIMFADIAGSTSLYETHGDDVARDMVARCIGIMNESLLKQQGRLIKTIGDEIMCEFPSAKQAMLAACDMQESVEKGKPGGKIQMFLRIGFHYGEVIRENDDVFGDAVNVAARMAGQARARQIISTKEAVDALPVDLKGKSRQIRRAAVKGKQEAMDIFQIIWQADDMDVTRVSMPAKFKPVDMPGQLVLRHLEQTFTLDMNNRSALLGRGSAGQIVVADDFASRQHAKIEYRDDKFILADLSINGTYVRFADGHVVHAVQEEVLLLGVGSISLGRAFFEPAAKLIDFEIPAPPAK